MRTFRKTARAVACITRARRIFRARLASGHIRSGLTLRGRAPVAKVCHRALLITVRTVLYSRSNDTLVRPGSAPASVLRDPRF